MAAPVSVVVVPAMAIGVVNAASDAFSHLTTVPVLPLNVRFAGEVPEQIVCADATIPPTVAGSTVRVAFCAKALLQFGTALVVVMPVTCKVCPLLPIVRVAEVKFAAPEPSATTPVIAVWATPLIEYETVEVLLARIPVRLIIAGEPSQVVADCETPAKVGIGLTITDSGAE
jgi:hypothetical protein